MKRSYSYLLTITVIFSMALFSGCGKPKPTSPVASEKEAPAEDTVRLTSEAIRQINLTILTINNQQLSQDIETTGQIAVNQNAVYQVGAFTTGQIRNDNAVLGDFVQRGQVLASLYNLDVAKIDANYLHEAHQNEIDISQARTRLALTEKALQREKRLYQQGISPRKDYEQAVSDYTLNQTQYKGQKEHSVHIRSEAKALLSAYGTSLSGLHTESVKATSPIVAPHSGIITKKNVTIGAIVSPGQELYEINDLNRVWLNLVIYPKDLSQIHLGQSVVFKTDSLPGRTFSGKIDIIPPVSTQGTATFLARAFLDNLQLRLKPGMAGAAQIHLNSKVKKTFVPEEAVQTYGKETFVFVALDNRRFRKRLIQLGERASNGYYVNAGLQAGDRVVGKGSFTLKAAMLKSQFAGDED